MDKMDIKIMQFRMAALTSSCKKMHKKVTVVRCKKLSYAHETYDKKYVHTNVTTKRKR